MTRPGPTARVLARKQIEMNAALAAFLSPPEVPSADEIMSHPTTRADLIATAGRWRKQATEAAKAHDWPRAAGCYGQARWALRAARGMTQ